MSAAASPRSVLLEVVQICDLLSRASWSGQDQKCPLLSHLGFPSGNRRPRPDFGCCSFSRNLRFCVPRAMTWGSFPCDCGQYPALSTGTTSTQEWIPGRDLCQYRSGAVGRECDPLIDGIRDGLAHSWKAFSGQDRLETCVCVLALLRHAAGLILSPNGILHRLLQASGSTTWESWSDQVLSATWHTPWLLQLLSGIRVFSREGGKQQTNKTPPLLPRK